MNRLASPYLLVRCDLVYFSSTSSFSFSVRQLPVRNLLLRLVRKNCPCCSQSHLPIRMIPQTVLRILRELNGSGLACECCKEKTAYLLRSW